MTTKRTTFIMLALIALACAAGAAAYPYLPEQIASHWNAAGEADGYTGKFWGVFLFPLLMIGLFAMYWGIPKIDPLKANIESFRRVYNGFWVFFLAFFFYVFGLSLAWNLGYRFDFSLAILPAFAALMYVAGILTEKSKRNWFVGIRTPWTLSSETVWDKTHRLGGRLFKLASFALLLGVFAPASLIVWFILVPVMVAALVPVVYSYIAYRDEHA